MAMAPQNPRQPIVVTHQGGLKFAAQVRSHRVFVDQPVHSGGDDSAPAPIELLGASLGTCIALYVQQFCQLRGLPYEGMRVEVETVGAANPNRIARFSARVVLPTEVPGKYAEAIERVARSCPAHNTLAGGAHVTVSVETSPRPALGYAETLT
jgi:putative redox protein